MLDENIADQFKVLNVPTLTRWNTSMSIREMLDQLEGTYGKPDTKALFANDSCSVVLSTLWLHLKHTYTELSNARRFRS
jgi:hypothetical protein